MTFSSLPFMPAWCRHFLQRMVNTPATFETIEQRRQSELLAALIIVLAPLSIVITLFIATFLDETTAFYQDEEFWIVSGGALLLGLPYWLNRRGHYQVAVYLFIAICFVVIFYTSVPTDDLFAETYFLDYLIIPILIASVFLKKRHVMLLAATAVASILSLLLLYPDFLRFGDLIGHISFIIVVSALIMIIVHHRTRLEQLRLKQIEESELRYRLMFDSSYNAVLVHDGNQTLFCNVSAARICGYQSPEEMMGKRFAEFIHPDDLDMVMIRAQQRLTHPDDPPPPRYQHRIIGADGVTRWVESVSAVITLDGEKVTMSNAIDITEQKANEAALKRQNAYLSALHETALGMLNRHNPDDLLGIILLRAGQLVGTGDGFIYLQSADKTRLERRVVMGILKKYQGGFVYRGQGVSGKVWQNGKPIIANEYDAWSNRLPDLESGVISAAMGVPLNIGNEVVGVIALLHTAAGRTFSEEEVSLLAQFADLASIALDNAFLYQTLERRNRMLETLNKISRATVSILETKQLLNTLAYFLAKVLNGTSAYIADWNPGTGTSTVLAEYVALEANEHERISDLNTTYHLEHDLGDDARWLYDPKGYHLIHVDELNPNQATYQHLRAFGAKTILAAPMRLEGKPIGYIEIWETRSRREFTQEEIELILSVATHATIALNKARLYAALRESEERNQVILRSMPDLVFRIGRDLVYRDVMARDYGDLLAPMEYIIGKTPFDMIPHDIALKAENAVQTALESGVMQVYEYELEVANGLQYYEARVVKSALDEALIFIRNITDRKQIQQREIELRLERERVRLLEDFISDASHDLKTPLSNLNSRLYLLRRAKDEESRERQINVIETEVQRLEKLIEDLLTMAHLDSKAAGSTFSVIDLNATAKEVVRAQQSNAERRGLALEFEPSPESLKIYGDLLDLERMMSNLINNAINYTPQGSIRVRTSINNQSILFEVEDTGIGIAEEDVQHIFERFYRADKARNTDRGGTGLGLAIVRKISEMHHARIVVKSEPGKGSIFSVWFPTQYDPTNHT